MENIPNAVLYRASDVYGNEIQALVPFGTKPFSVFELLHGDFDGNEPIEKITVVYAATIRSFLNKTNI